MIVKGKVVKSQPGQPEKIQKKINVLDNLKSDIKSIDIPKPDNDDYGMGADFQGLGFNIFQNENKEFQERMTRYAYFREMAQTELINRALEIVSDDATQFNGIGNTIEVESSDENIRQKLLEMFERLEMNNELWSIVFETTKMGDNFYEVIVDDYKKPKKIIYLRHLNPDKVERVEKNGVISYFNYKEVKYNKITSDKVEEKIYKYLPWQIIHFKIESKDFKPYGVSLLNTAIKSFKRLAVLEDIMLVYRISRAPERRVFYIDVGNLNKSESARVIEKLKNQYRSQDYIDENGNINKRARILSVTSDIFVPVREGTQGTRIETLQGGEALDQIHDVKYFYNRILRTMNIPPAYMGDETDRSRGSLAQLDIKFSKFVERVQSHIVKGLNKLAALELYFNGESKDVLTNFKLALTPPSSIKEITDIDLLNQKFQLYATIQATQSFSDEWLLRNILKMSEKEITDIIMQKNLSGQPAGQGEPGAAGGGEGLGGLPVDVAGEETPPPSEETPPEPVNQDVFSSSKEGILIEAIGKDFVANNQKEFFKYYKLLKEYMEKKEMTSNTVMNEVQELFAPKSQKKVNWKTNNIGMQIYLREFGGLTFNGNRSMTLYEEDENGKNKKVKISLNE